ESLSGGITLGQCRPAHWALAPIARWDRRSGSTGGTIARKAIFLAGLLVCHEEEQLVFLDWSTERAAILVRVQDRLGQALRVSEPGVRIQRSIAKEFKRGTMEGVRSGLRNHIHVRARIPAVSSVVARGLNFEFRNGIGIRNRKPADRYSFDACVKAPPVVDDYPVLKESVLG